jgi:hypothetical protein
MAIWSTKSMSESNLAHSLKQNMTSTDGYLYKESSNRTNGCNEVWALREHVSSAVEAVASEMSAATVHSKGNDPRPLAIPSFGYKVNKSPA